MRLWLFVLLLVSTLAEAAAPQPLVRSRLEPAQAVVGQRVRLAVTVLVPGWFVGPIDYPPGIEAAGLGGRLADGAAINFSERIGGTTYAGMTREYELVASQAGEFTVPALALGVQYASDATPRSATLHTPAHKLTARLPPGAENLRYFLATPAYRLSQTLDRPLADLNRLKVGDALTRRLTQRAEGVAAMHLPALRFAAIEGIASYPAEPRLLDSGGERGAARIGERSDEIGYVLQRAGDYELPGLEIQWYDPGVGKLRSARVPALRLSVAPNPAAAPPAPTPTSRAVPPAPTFGARLVLLSALGLAVAMLALALLKRRGGALYGAWRVRRAARRNSETAAFRRCRHALRRQSPSQAQAALYAWLVHLSLPPGRPPLQLCAERWGDEALRAALVDWQAGLYGRQASATPADGRVLAAALARARQRWLANARRAPDTGIDLPALNTTRRAD